MPSHPRPQYRPDRVSQAQGTDCTVRLKHAAVLVSRTSRLFRTPGPQRLQFTKCFEHGQYHREGTIENPFHGAGSCAQLLAPERMQQVCQQCSPKAADFEVRSRSRRYAQRASSTPRERRHHRGLSLSIHESRDDGRKPARTGG
jgi:hypothetical protein